MFWDVERKWTKQNRFAGQSISSGHFFAVTPDGALAELNAYHENVEEYDLLRFTIFIDNLLNLTARGSLDWFYEKYLFGPKNLHWALILDSLLAQQLGGDNFNDYAGHKALLEGYTGLVFFGARAAASHWPNPGTLELSHGGSLNSRDPDLIAYQHEAMRDDPACINVVIYFGQSVVSAIREIAINDTIIKNRLFRASHALIDDVFMKDPEKPPNDDLTYENLRARAARIRWLTTPGFGHDPGPSWFAFGSKAD
jgi:hypothetical protein